MKKLTSGTSLIYSKKIIKNPIQGKAWWDKLFSVYTIVLLMQEQSWPLKPEPLSHWKNHNSNKKYYCLNRKYRSNQIIYHLYVIFWQESNELTNKKSNLFSYAPLQCQKARHTWKVWLFDWFDWLLVKRWHPNERWFDRLDFCNLSVRYVYKMYAF